MTPYYIYIILYETVRMRVTYTVSVNKVSVLKASLLDRARNTTDSLSVICLYWLQEYKAASAIIFKL